MALSAPKLKMLRSLARRRERETRGLLLAEGVRLVREAMAAGAGIVAAYYTEKAAEESASLIGQLRRHAHECAVISHRELEHVSDVVTSQGVLAVVRWQSVSQATLLEGVAEDALLVACDALSDPGNLGSVLRTCAWFGVAGVMLGTGSVDVSNPKVVRGSMGAIFRLRIAQEVDLGAALEVARQADYRIYGADASAGERHDHAAYGSRTVVVLGNEAHGLSEPVRRRVDLLVRIPRYGEAESLNVAVACGILLAAARTSR
jgi:TrmH family RNA methyltransferase